MKIAIACGLAAAALLAFTLMRNDGRPARMNWEGPFSPVFVEPADARLFFAAKNSPPDPVRNKALKDAMQPRRMSLVINGTPVRVLERAGAITRIRVASGKDRGLEGWAIGYMVALEED